MDILCTTARVRASARIKHALKGDSPTLSYWPWYAFLYKDEVGGGKTSCKNREQMVEVIISKAISQVQCKSVIRSDPTRIDSDGCVLLVPTKIYSYPYERKFIVNTSAQGFNVHMTSYLPKNDDIQTWTSRNMVFILWYTASYRSSTIWIFASLMAFDS